jgi:hypothetical protein
MKKPRKGAFSRGAAIRALPIDPEKKAFERGSNLILADLRG